MTINPQKLEQIIKEMKNRLKPYLIDIFDKSINVKDFVHRIKMDIEWIPDDIHMKYDLYAMDIKKLEEASYEELKTYYLIIKCKKEFYLMDENKMVYKVADIVMDESDFTFEYQLELVAGWDYESDVQGYVKVDNFIEAVQSEYFFFSPKEETLMERLGNENLKVVNIKKLKIQEIIA